VLREILGLCEEVKTSFAKVGAYSAEENFIRGDPEGVIEWISGEADAFKEILIDRGDVCVFSGARGISAILEKAGCDHIKAIAQALMGGKFYNDVWVNGG
jgi:hypothetical protein